MKLFHLADLHIGKKLNQVDLYVEQKLIFEEILSYIDQEQPDAILLAGDIYDRRNPSLEAIALCDWFFSELILEKKVKVFAIGGNHDSGIRLEFANHLLSRLGLHLMGEFRYPLPEVALYDDYGEIIIHLFPFADLATLSYQAPHLLGKTYDEAVACLLEEIDCDDGKRHILMTHAMVIGTDELVCSDSERLLSVGGALSFSAKCLEKFDYVALGHMHKAQAVSKEYIRYSGSPYPYSFSEENHQKEISMIVLDQEGFSSYQSLPLLGGRRLKTIRGYFEDFLEVKNCSYQNDFLRVELLDEGGLIEPMNRLKVKYPNILQLVRLNEKAIERQDEKVFAREEKLSDPLDLFAYFYETMNEKALEPETKTWLERILNTGEGDSDETIIS